MPKKLKNQEGLTPEAKKIINTPTNELNFILRRSDPSDIVAAHIALKNEELYPAKQRIIKKYIEGPGDQKPESQKLIEDLRSAWFMKFSADWERTCKAIRHKALA